LFITAGGMVTVLAEAAFSFWSGRAGEAFIMAWVRYHTHAGPGKGLKGLKCLRF
jgi:hypothetical protein